MIYDFRFMILRLQRYNKKMTYASIYHSFCRFYCFLAEGGSAVVLRIIDVWRITNTTITGPRPEKVPRTTRERPEKVCTMMLRCGRGHIPFISRSYRDHMTALIRHWSDIDRTMIGLIGNIPSVRLFEICSFFCYHSRTITTHPERHRWVQVLY